MSDEFKKGLEGLDQGAATTPEGAPEAAPQAEGLPPHPTVDALREKFGDAVLRHEVVAGDEHIVFIDPTRAKEILSWLRDAPDHRYDFLKDVTAVDYGNGVFLQVVWELWSIEFRRQLRVKADLPLDALEVDSVYYLWRAADWLERETYDMFGIVFTGHPDLRRILMPYNYAEGYPLRKDFPLRGRFSRLEQTRRSLSMTVEDHYSPHEIEVARRLGQPLPQVMGDDGGAGVPNRGLPGVGGH
ncbi:MAG TPA: NADH-quinone oxidoreductase subunit C [Longimicrobiaceae bacterium]|nr:NADH-quinone oxidoreductase subunit C [Longimicrobiaceae bacterium]